MPAIYSAVILYEFVSIASFIILGSLFHIFDSLELVSGYVQIHGLFITLPLVSGLQSDLVPEVKSYSKKRIVLFGLVSGSVTGLLLLALDFLVFPVKWADLSFNSVAVLLFVFWLFAVTCHVLSFFFGFKDTQQKKDNCYEVECGQSSS